MTAADPLTNLEKSKHFYNRGRDTTRLEAFVDAAFAFALTLLVISFDAVPTSYVELVAALKAAPAFLFGFLILAMFWVAHRNWSVRYGLDTTFASIVSLALVFILLVYVYPLRAMATEAMARITGGWVASEFAVRTAAEARGLFVVYGTGFVASNLCLVLLFWHALRRADRIGLTPEERFLTRGEIAAWSIVGGAGLLSMLLAVLLPESLLGFAGWAYALLGLVMPVFGVVLGRRFDARFPDADPDR